MAEFQDKYSIDETDAIRALENLVEKMTQADNTNEAFIKGLQSGFDGAESFVKGLVDELNEQIKTQKKLEDQQKKNTKQNKEFNDGLKEISSGIKVFGVDLNGTISNLKAKRAALSSVNKGFLNWVKTLKITKTALISTGIGAFVVLLGSLVAVLSKTEAFQDKVNQVLKAGSSVFNNIRDRAEKFLGVIRNLLKLKFREAMNSWSDATQGLGKELREDAKAAIALEKAAQQLEERQITLSQKYAESRKEVKALNKVAEDTTKSLQERESAARKAITIEQDLLEERKSLAQENLDLIKQENSLSKSSREDKQKEAQAAAELAQIETESLELQTTLNNKLNTIRAEATAKIQAQRQELEGLRDDYFKIIEEVNSRLQTLELDSLSPVDRLEKEKEIALAEIDLLEERARAHAEAAGLVFEAEEKFHQLRLAAAKNYDDQIQEIIESRNVRIIEPLTETAEKIGIETARAIDRGASKESQKSSFLQDFRGSLGSALGLNGAELDQALSQFGGLVDGVGSLWAEGVDNLIGKNQELLDSIRARREEIEAELESELEKASRGYATNVDLKRRELAEIKKEEEKAEKESQKLRKQKLAAELASQASSLATAAAQVLAAESKKGLLGVLFAAGAILTMFSIFRRAKTQATAATRAYKGGPLADYLRGERDSGLIGGPSDIPGKGNGMRVEGTNLRIGGDEFLVRAKSTRKNLKHLNKVNSGYYDNVDLDEILEKSGYYYMVNSNQQMRKGEAQIIQMEAAASQRNQYRAMVEAYSKVAGEQTDKLIKYFENKKEIIPRSKEGYIEKQGNTTSIIKTF